MAAPVPPRNDLEVTLDSTASLGLLIDHLDVTVVVKAFQAVSTEIAFEQFINRLLVTAVEHAGAERGLLLLPRSGGFSIDAEAVAHAESVDVRLRGEVATESDLP